MKSKLLLKLSALVALLKTLGALGMLLMAILDSAAIVLPVDAALAGYVYATPRRAWLYVLAAAVGSALGCLLPYVLGRAGGELFLLKRIDEAKLRRIRDRFEKQEFLALMIPAMLPPPTPFKLLVFSAGVFEMRVITFLLAIVSGRLVRFGALAVLTVFFGPQIVSQAKNLLKNHPSLVVLIVIAVAGLVYLLYRLLREPVTEVKHEMEHAKESAQH